MRRAVVLAAAGATLATCALPAGAAQGDDRGPAGYGWSCGMAVARTAPDRYQGVVTGGPWFVDEPGARVMVRCVVEAFGPYGWHEVASTASAPSSSPAFLPPTVSAFGEPPTSGRIELQMCTEITVYKNPNTPPDVHRVDADDDPSNGGQCAKNEASGDDLLYTGVFPPTFHGGRRCTYVERPDGVPPDGPHEVCAPSPV
jgi:hypothetical protein